MDAKEPPYVAYRFDRFTLDLRRGVLLGEDGRELPLRPKSFALLQLLVENAGRLLNRDTIMREVWPDVFVTDDSITQCIRDIRRALEDESQRLLRTMPRRGYLFVVQVSPIQAVRGVLEEPPRSALLPTSPLSGGAYPQPSLGEPMPVCEDGKRKVAAYTGVLEVGAWLRGLGLGQYETAFRESAIDAAMLPRLTAEDLRSLGVAIGHTRKLLDAIAGGSSGSDLGGIPKSTAGDPAHSGKQVGQAERRQVTVLYCDLVGSTALSSRLDPEDLREILAAYQRCVAEVIARSGGYVARYMGDGILAYFGYPEAHEDDAERAVRAGLALVEAVADLRSPGGPLAARVGIATGLVVAGDLLGEGLAQERGVVGQTPNVAARLQGLAEPSAIVADLATRDLTGRLFLWADLGSVALKGISAPVRISRVLGESGIESRFQALRPSHTAPLIGREEELDLLLRRWRRARSSLGQVVLLRGEPGIGKSRLAAALQEALWGEEHEGFVLFCSPQHTDSPLHPVVARLGRAAGLSRGDSPEERLSKLEALLTPLDPPPEDVALIADLLSVPTQGRWPVLDLSLRRQREQLLEALVRRLRALAARKPMLVVIEDAHWADPTTRELLDLLIAEAPKIALLLITTYRPEFDTGTWIGMPHVTLMQLNRLARIEHLALLRQVAGKALPAEVEAEILSRTDGVPLFVEEVTRGALERGLVREEAGRWIRDDRLVPASLQASLVARLDRLSSAREVAQAAAVLGREFAHDLLAAVVGLPEPALREALDRLAAADLVQRRGIPPDAVYTFRHALIQDAAYATLLRERRRQLHARAAKAIERLQPEITEREPEVLAYHRAEVGEAEAATALYLRAGERAAARSAFREARAHLTRGLALLPGVQEEKSARQLEAGLRVALGNVAVADKGLGSAESGEAFGRAVELCRGLRENDSLTWVLRGLWAYKFHTGHLAEALRLAEEFVGVARRRGPAEQLSRSLASLGATRYLLGRHDLARPVLEEVCASPDAYAAGGIADVSGGSLAGHFLMRLLADLGKLELSAERVSEVVERARAAGHPYSLAAALSGQCVQAWLARDTETLRRGSRDLADLAELHGFPFFASRARESGGWVAVEEGRIDGGIGLIAGSLEALRTSGHVLYTALLEAKLSDAYLLNGNADAAFVHVEEALRISSATGQAWFDSDLHRRLGRVLLRLVPDDMARAEAEFLRALDVARSQSTLLYELRAARDLARLWRDRGRLVEARELLAPVYAAFTEGFAFPDLVEARALLEELASDAGFLPGCSKSAAGSARASRFR